jgi:regulation of enolase protein 1 (concanavalin A-like superfamily)
VGKAAAPKFIKNISDMTVSLNSVEVITLSDYFVDEDANPITMEVTFVLDYSGQFDQAGIIVHSDSQHWIKAGVESADGSPQVGAVVTSINSDWSLAPVPQWMGKQVTVRASRTTDALTIRARCGEDDQLIRLAPIDSTLKWSAGPHCASPISTSLDITFTHWTHGDADLALH